MTTQGSVAPETRVPPSDEAPAGENPPGDRGIPSVNRVRSVQARVSSAFALALMSTLGLGALTWYYAHTWHRPAQAHLAAEVASRNRARGEMALPSLGHVAGPKVAQEPASTSSTAASGSISSFTQGRTAAEGSEGNSYPPGRTPTGTTPVTVTPVAAAPKSPWKLALERRLAGPPFARSSSSSFGSSSPVINASSAGGASTVGTADSGASSGTLESMLRPTVSPTVAASMLPARRFLLGKGTFIDCTLETAIDSSLPGMTTCITATDTYSADGSVVLLERGTKLVGETRGQIQPGTARIFVLWSEARTPTGVIVPLSSPGTDALGRSGLEGNVNRHFWERFGAAILLTVINGAVQGAANAQNSSGSVVVSPSSSTDIMAEVLKGTVNVAATLTKSQGDRIQVFVARDVDFRPVYELRTASVSASAPSSAPSQTAP